MRPSLFGRGLPAWGSWGDLDGVRSATVQALADDGLEIFAEAGFDRGEMIAPTAKQDAALREARIRLREKVEDCVGCQADLMINVLELRWDFEGVERLVLHLKKVIRSDARAGAMLCPLVLE